MASTASAVISKGVVLTEEVILNETRTSTGRVSNKDDIRTESEFNKDAISNMISK